MTRIFSYCLAMCYLILCASNSSTSVPNQYTRKISEKDITRSYIFKENMPQLSSRRDILRNRRAPRDLVHRVIFVIRQKNKDELTRILHYLSDPSSSSYGQHLSRDEVAKFTSNTESRDAVLHFLKLNGATIVSETLNGTYIGAEAPIAVWEMHFNTEFFTFQQTQRNGRIDRVVRAESYSVPIELDIHVESVLNTIEMTYNVFDSSATLQKRSSTSVGMITPRTLKSFYNMSNARGSDKSTQAVYASMNSYFSPNDLKTFQTNQGLDIRSPMTVGDHVDHTKCVISKDSCSESNLDIQYIMGISQESPTTHWYTDGSFTDWFISVLSYVHVPMVLTISYGTQEKYVTSSELESFNTIAIICGTLGVTILVASGDDGANSRSVRGGNYKACGYTPYFPASCPYVTAIGATSGLETGTTEVVCQGDSVGQIITSGGGFSEHYPQPWWQASAVSAYFESAAGDSHTPQTGYGAKGRGYPDLTLAGSQYTTIVGGEVYLVSGTSASAPVMAGFISNINAVRIAAGMGSVGWINPTLYAKASLFVNDITAGNTLCVGDGTCCIHGFHATKGWDPASGLGSVNYGKMLSLFSTLGGTVILPIDPLTDPPTPRPTVASTVAASFPPSIGTQIALLPSMRSQDQSVGTTVGIILGVAISLLAFLLLSAVAYLIRKRISSTEASPVSTGGDFTGADLDRIPSQSESLGQAYSCVILGSESDPIPPQSNAPNQHCFTV